MKRLLICIILISSLKSFTQDKLAEYTDPYGGKQYDIQISFKDNGKFNLFINAFTLDFYDRKGGFYISEKQLPEFLNNLGQAAIKYSEWRKTAIENNVTEVSKEIPIESQRISGYFYAADKWMFDYSVSPTFRFWISKFPDSDKIEYCLIVGTGKLVSSSNEYIDCKGYELIFTSIKEIADFINLISMENIKEYQNKPKANELFK